MNYTECDPFVYSSILEAIEEVNQNGMVIKNNQKELLAVKFKLFHAITEVTTRNIVILYSSFCNK